MCETRSRRSFQDRLEPVVFGRELLDAAEGVAMHSFGESQELVSEPGRGGHGCGVWRMWVQR